MAEIKRVVIVGGVAGGASAAARARRLNEAAEIIVFERGPHISFANCGMPYYIGGTIRDRERLLVQTAAGMRQRYRLDIRTHHEVERIDPRARTLTVRNLESGATTTEPYDALILSPGAEPVRPPIPGADHRQVFTLRSLVDMDRIKRAVDAENPGRAVIIGGGYIGLEMAEALRRRNLAVTLVELAPQVFVAADPEMVAPIHQQLAMNGVDLRLGTSVTAIAVAAAGSDEAADLLRVQLSTGESVAAGLVILAVGVRPEVKLAREAGLAIGPTGGIVVDVHMRTSDPAIYAVGDAAEVTHFVAGTQALIPLAGPANRQGRIAADNLFGRPSVYRQTQGTAICKVFDLAIGMTGLSEKALRKAGSAYEKIYVHPASHASYYPGAAPMTLKLLFDPADGRILGAQAVGADGIDKRIDVIATAMRGRLTVRDLGDLELSYAPPYGSAKDPVNYAGFVASGVLDGDVRLCHTEDMVHPSADQLLVDVRTPGEVAAGTIPGAVNVPLDALRDRLGELPKDKELLVFCQAGLRGYLACRTLSQNGFRCRNLTGGYKIFRATVGSPPTGKPPKQGTPSPKQEITSDSGEKDPQPSTPVDPPAATIVKEIDATGLQCPGPIMRLNEEVSKIQAGQAIAITAGDLAFPADVAAWCHSTGHRLAGIAPKNGAFRAVILKNEAPCPSPAGASEPPAASKPKDKTLVVFSGDFDKAMAAFIIANGAAAMGSNVTMFFTFWGLNILRRPEKIATRKTLVERMFGWMMPRGADRLTLSKMNMGGMGLAMMKGIMRRKHVAPLADMIASARRAGVRLVACSMSMDLMGIKREEMLDGVEEGGVATYLDRAEAAAVNLFI
jgi:NADPH-dependent 2,4-dienoyl-CoA reductase/sulfur reductase-like enzyme/peroxiredoxin family protein/rhodanese-related sulfurtransferase/TusA-related sulfurtransferase